MTMNQLIDISPVLSPATAVWPGDTPLSRAVLLDMNDDANITLSTLKTTVHIGAHADAPSHYSRDGASIDQAQLHRYWGVCHVVPLEKILVTEISHPRVLIATGNHRDPNQFDRTFAPLSVELIDWLHQRGVFLIGVDTPSVDHVDSKDLPVHHACARCDISIIEGLILTAVAPGEYELSALPLKLQGFDASPVRAVLRPLATSSSA